MGKWAADSLHRFSYVDSCSPEVPSAPIWIVTPIFVRREEFARLSMRVLHWIGERLIEMQITQLLLRVANHFSGSGKETWFIRECPAHFHHVVLVGVKASFSLLVKRFDCQFKPGSDLRTKIS